MLWAAASSKGGASKTTLLGLTAERLQAIGVGGLRLADGDCQASLSAWSERSAGRLPPCEQVFPQGYGRLAQREGLTLLDLPSGLGPELQAAVLVADLLLVPITPSALEFHTVPTTLSAVAFAQERRDGWPKALLIPSKLCLRRPSSKRLLRWLESFQEWPVTRAFLKERSAFERAGERGLGALPRSSRRDAELELAELVDEILLFARAMARSSSFAGVAA